MLVLPREFISERPLEDFLCTENNNDSNLVITRTYKHDNIILETCLEMTVALLNAPTLGPKYIFFGVDSNHLIKGIRGNYKGANDIFTHAFQKNYLPRIIPNIFPHKIQFYSFVSIPIRDVDTYESLSFCIVFFIHIQANSIRSPCHIWSMKTSGREDAYLCDADNNCRTMTPTEIANHVSQSIASSTLYSPDSIDEILKHTAAPASPASPVSPVSHEYISGNLQEMKIRSRIGSESEPASLFTIKKEDVVRLLQTYPQLEAREILLRIQGKDPKTNLADPALLKETRTKLGEMIQENIIGMQKKKYYLV